jgi:hypothetical protein
LRLVHAYQTDYVESGDQFVHLWRFADTADAYMEEVHDLRAKLQIDRSQRSGPSVDMENFVGASL